MGMQLGLSPKGRTQRVFENKVLMGIFGPNKQEATDGEKNSFILCKLW
jgi:hypothetical protein